LGRAKVGKGGKQERIRLEGRFRKRRETTIGTSLKGTKKNQAGSAQNVEDAVKRSRNKNTAGKGRGGPGVKAFWLESKAKNGKRSVGKKCKHCFTSRGKEKQKQTDTKSKNTSQDGKGAGA